MSVDRFFVQYFEGGPGSLATFSVLERNGCKDCDHRIVCDCLVYGDGGPLDEQAERDAETIALGLNGLLCKPEVAR